MSDWRNRLNMIVQKMKAQLFAKGCDSIQKLEEVFKQFDANGNGILEKLEFNEMLTKMGIFLSTQELRTIYDNFDLNNDGGISYTELTHVLRNIVSDTRVNTVRLVFQQLSHGEPSVHTDILKKQYKAAAHPRVVSRQLTEETQWKYFCDGMAKNQLANGYITEQGFMDYYLDQFCMLPSEKDQWFQQAICAVWSINSVGGRSDTRSKDYVPTARIN